MAQSKQSLDDILFGSSPVSQPQVDVSKPALEDILFGQQSPAPSAVASGESVDDILGTKTMKQPVKEKPVIDRFTSYGKNIAKGMREEEKRKKSGERGDTEKLLDTVANFGARAAIGVVDTVGEGLKFVGDLGGLIDGVGEEAKGAVKYVTDMARKGTNMEFKKTDEDLSSKFGEGYGKFSGTALGAMMGGGAAKELAQAAHLPALATFIATSLGGTTGLKAAESGRLPTPGEAATGLVFDTAMLGLSKLISRFSPENMINKASGLTPTQRKNISDQIARFTDPKTGKPFYDNIDDFLLKNDITGSREQMVDKVQDLFEQSKEIKTDLLKNIDTRTNNNFDDLFEYLKKTYDTPGNQSTLSEIDRLSKRMNFSAEELGKVLKLGDSSLPRGAYSGMEPVRTEGIQNLLDPIRSRLIEIDPTGTLKKLNLNKSILSGLGSPTKDLTSALTQSSQRSLGRQMAFRGAEGGAMMAGASMVPVVGQIAGGIAGANAVVDALTSIPQVSSSIAKLGLGIKQLKEAANATSGLGSGNKLLDYLVNFVRTAPGQAKISAGTALKDFVLEHSPLK